MTVKEKVSAEVIKLKIKGLTTSYCIKQAGQHKEDYIFFNENGLEYYSSTTQKVSTQNCFDITNCGIALNSNSTKLAVADFGGNVYIFAPTETSLVPQPLARILIGIPVRSLTWCHDTDRIVIGCVGGYLWVWDGVAEEATMLCQTNDHTVNIVRYY